MTDSLSKFDWRALVAVEQHTVNFNMLERQYGIPRFAGSYVCVDLVTGFNPEKALRKLHDLALIEVVTLEDGSKDCVLTPDGERRLNTSRSAYIPYFRTLLARTASEAQAKYRRNARAR